MEIRIHDDRERLADAAADLVASVASRTRTTSIGLAGGSTPEATYRRLAHRRVDLTGATLWLGDERWVPPDHDDANGRMAREALGPAHGAEVLVPDWDLGEPELAAAGYELAIERSLDGRAPDLVLLGMGDDGHTASLFPATSALTVTDRSYVANWVEAKDTWRLTATIPFLAAAQLVVFLVAGDSKAAMVRRVLELEEPFPARLVTDEASEVVWMLDAPAAAELRRLPR